MRLNEVIPWGRSFDEYRRMFALTDGDLSGNILGCGDGPASFNAEATVLGNRVVSCDPIYTFSADEIERQVRAPPFWPSTFWRMGLQFRHNLGCSDRLPLDLLRTITMHHDDTPRHRHSNTPMTKHHNSTPHRSELSCAITRP